MPWIALLCLGLVGACRFDADYSDGTVRCRDGECPSGLECREDLDFTCRALRMDAAIDTPLIDDAIDAHMADLTCSDPGILPATNTSEMNTTATRDVVVAPMCNGTFMNGRDAVYKIEPGSGRQMRVAITAITGGYSVTAYVMNPSCPTTACLNNTYATPGSSITITTLAGSHYIVVDSNIAGMGGEYQLAVTFP